MPLPQLAHAGCASSEARPPADSHIIPPLKAGGMMGVGSELSQEEQTLFRTVSMAEDDGSAFF